MNNAVIMSKLRGYDWEDWAANPTTSLDDFANNYLLPYINYTTAKYGDASHYYIYLADGSYFYLHFGDCMDLKFDFNGLKKPNIEGRDIFTFLFCPYSKTNYLNTGKIIPVLSKNLTRDQVLSFCKTTNKLYCSGVLYLDSWEFKDDYPHKI